MRNKLCKKFVYNSIIEYIVAGDNVMEFVKKTNAQLFLFINAFLWGSSYVWSKMLLGYLPRYSILFLCAFGGLVTTLIVFRKRVKKISFKTFLIVLCVTFFSVISNTFCMLALQYTTSSNAAFIVQITVILTPLITGLIERKKPSGKILFSGIIALAGLFLLTCDFNSFKFNSGDLFALGNALFFTLYIIALDKALKKVDTIGFSVVHHSVNSVVFLVLALTLESQAIDINHLVSPVFIMLILASTFVAIFTVLFQSEALRFVRPEKATLIYTLEPVTALLLAFVLIGERFRGLYTAVGCILIILSVAISLIKTKGLGTKISPLFRKRHISRLVNE